MTASKQEPEYNGRHPHYLLLERAKKAAAKAEREQLRERYVEYMGHPCPELAEKYNHGCDAEYCGLCILDEVLESLRAQQGGE